jgi:hypothetical protein
MRPEGMVRVVTFLVSRELVDCDVSESHFVSSSFIILTIVLALLFYLVNSEFVYNFLDTVLQEALERLNLLVNETVNLEVTINYFPTVISVDWLHVFGRFNTPLK